MDSGSEHDLPDLFLRTARRIRRSMHARLAPLGLTPGQARALRILGRSTEPLRMAALAERLDIVPRSATTVVDSLVTAGLVTRAADPASRRSTLVTPTEAGRAVLERMAEDRRRAAADLFATLSPPQRDTLRELLALLDVDSPEDCGPNEPRRAG
ncbi:MarR family winged helix-turn-helix transcriptional regulator [Nocardia goodfellowii]|uniref:DNA-binding MarR family transcriptional regulator n=1 Tax=Nocardia goodfellowii TaxID=882446 RepID=A0ABS4QGS9_9NOCA|nr:MarR family transcriptional regulator [Nocardia goodfellowii]MBP2190912.1 DNA-binding MarR family transcriptional regulator [Nocardia goodfellowii]